jgi:hemolysin activation/secretion protein
MNCSQSLSKPSLSMPVAAMALALAVSAGIAAAQPKDMAATIDSSQTFVTNLQGILVVPAKEGAVTPQELLGNINPGGVTGIKGVVVKGPQFLQRPDFTALLGKHLGLPLTSNALAQIQVEIVRYCRTHDHMVVDVFTSEQDLLEDTIQIAVIEGRVGNITVTNEFHKWFSDSVILHDVRLKPGDTVLESRLKSDLAWLNRNNYQSLGYDEFNGSFRDVSSHFKQGDLGHTDLELKVEDRFPFRPYVGADDTGIEVIGRYRGHAGFNWGNAFGLDHRLNYEYITD